MPETSLPAPSEAIAVLQKFLDASAIPDLEGMKSCLSKKTLESGQYDPNGQSGIRYELAQGVMEGDIAVIPVKAFATDAPADSPPAMELPAMLVQEDGHWKFDLGASMERMMGGSMQSVMDQMVDTLGQAVGGIGDMISQAFGESASSSAPNWLETPAPDYAPEELFPLPEMAEFPKLSAALSTICQHPVSAGCAIKDLLYQLHSDDRQQLIDWFDTQLFEAWISMFALLAQKYPVIKRLRGIRVEAGKHTDQRMMILDGSDLVYRVWLNTTDGYYSDEYVQSLLPGLLAALPEEPDPQVVGHRLIHKDDEPANVELFKERVVPRTMRRICEALGKNIELEADWDDLFNPSEDARQMWRWTLNRVHGAIALACLDPKRREKLAAELNKIHLIWVSSAEDRAAVLEDGTLTVSICHFREEAGCFYERALDAVLAGEPVVAASAAEESGSEETSEEESSEKSEEPSVEIKAQRLNDENFRSAAASLKENEPIWSNQLELVLHHPAPVHLDFDSLNGRFDLVQPFMHQGLTAAIEAITRMAFDPDIQSLGAEIHEVTIRGTATGDEPSGDLTDGMLTLYVPLVLADVRAPTDQVLDLLRKMAGKAAPAKEEPASRKDNFSGSPYAAAAESMLKLEAVLRKNNLWPGGKPAGKIEVKGAFGCENMAFTQWLAWVLIERVNDIVATLGSFPNGSRVSTYAIRELGGTPGGEEVLDVLREFDDLVNSLAK